MIRKIIHIDKDACTGCGLCATACHEGAIQMLEGKAVLTREDYCDGLGDCLPACPAGAISFIEKEAPAYDLAAAELAMRRKKEQTEASKTQQTEIPEENTAKKPMNQPAESCLSQWPVQIKLAPAHAPYFDQADLLIAADCSAFAYGSFHQDFIRGHITLIGCPKLDSIDYSDKLTEILGNNQIRSVTVVRMEVPCCGGIQFAAEHALKNCGKSIPYKVITIGINGKLVTNCTFRVPK